MPRNVLLSLLKDFPGNPEVTIQMKATEEYFPVVLFITLYMGVQCFESVDKIVKSDHSNFSFWILSQKIIFFC